MDIEYGKLSASSITSTQLDYLSNVTSNIQTQLNDKLPLSGGTLTGTVYFGSDKTYYINSSGIGNLYGLTLPYGRALYFKDSEGNSRNGISFSSHDTYSNIYYIATGGITNAVQIGSASYTSLITLATSGGVIARKKLVVGTTSNIGVNSGVQLSDNGTIVLSSSSTPKMRPSGI